MGARGKLFALFVAFWVICLGLDCCLNEFSWKIPEGDKVRHCVASIYVYIATLAMRPNVWSKGQLVDSNNDCTHPNRNIAKFAINLHIYLYKRTAWRKRTTITIIVWERKVATALIQLFFQECFFPGRKKGKIPERKTHSYITDIIYVYHILVSKNSNTFMVNSSE